ncbi:MAG TPA: methylenetetrahydrofolate reductase C-terminal domain-containing protein [archaeon]|nr:methylenetetrahydrofolate reductase C-terminal domain-containing protein [archaeon]
MENRFKEKISQSGGFVISVELVPSRGLMRKDFEELIAFTEQAVDYGKIDALSLTDNPGGNPRLSPDVLGLDIMYRGMSPLIHLTSKDHNRNALESRAFQLNRMGIENVLALTGDYPVDGYQGVAKPSFDLDSVGMIKMLRAMNKGLKVPLPRPGKFQELEPTNFFIGASVSPFKKLRSELLGQYIKLEKKIKNGARFIITQVGYDMLKFDELLRYMRLSGLDTPVLGNVYVLHRIVSRLMNQNQVPGCVVTDELLEFVNTQAKAEDKGKAAFREFAAKQVAVLRGLGYRGAHIGGFGLSFDDVRKIIDTAEELSSDWQSLVKEIRYPQKGEFFYFQADPETGLNTDQPNDSGDWEEEKTAMTPYRLMKLVHDGFFEPDSLGFKVARQVCSRIDGSPTYNKAFRSFEKLIKSVANNCQECGDCSLDELGFVCPEAYCAKASRNGPCGGSAQGICELQDRPCFWVKVINRLEKDGALETLRNPDPIYRNNSLDKTSSWINYYLGRDHKKITFGEKEEKTEKG